MKSMKSAAALTNLYSSVPAAKIIGAKAKAVYAFLFDQKGLMAGIGLQGSKITKLDK
jgi:lipid-binding SYLF domain-containing protein